MHIKLPPKHFFFSKKKRKFLLNKIQKNNIHHNHPIELSNTNISTLLHSSIDLHKLHSSTYGFHTNPFLSIHKNLQNYILNTDITNLVQPKNLSYHNLCTLHKAPPLSNLLLGLGHKFCIEPYLPSFDLSNTFSKITKQVRLQAFLHTHNLQNENSTYNPKIYINSNFQPPIADTLTESLLAEFKEAILVYASNKLSNIQPNHNLSKLQRNILHKLKDTNEITICLSDKNLGPVIIDTVHYIKLAIKIHLSNENTYQNLSTEEAFALQEETKNMLMNIYKSYSSQLSSATKTYFTRSFSKPTRTPIFYQLIKIHKMKSPSDNITTRPVISCINSFTEIFSKYCDVLLETLSEHVPTKLKDSFEVLHDLQNLPNPLPHDTHIITADAVSMYTNINPAHACQILDQWLTLYKDELPPNFPSSFLVKSIEIIMTRNIFKFGHTHFIQKRGLAMGTSCAVMLATVYYGFHERTLLLPKYSHLFLYFKRFVDDLIFISKRKLTQFELHSLLSDLNFGDLSWTCNGQLKTQTFLDLDITIKNNKIHFKTHIKKHNLHLYIPPTSCHPPHCLKSLIYGMLYRFYLQNSDTSDYISFTKAFFKHLLARGHDEPTLLHLFTQASVKLDQKLSLHKNINPFTNKNLSNHKTTSIRNIFFHTEYHPKNLNSALIQNTFSKTLQKLHYINNLTICNHRPKNIRDILIPTDLLHPHKELPSSTST